MQHPSGLCPVDPVSIVREEHKSGVASPVCHLPGRGVKINLRWERHKEKKKKKKKRMDRLVTWSLTLRPDAVALLVLWSDEDCTHLLPTRTATRATLLLFLGHLGIRNTGDPGSLAHARRGSRLGRTEADSRLAS